MAFGLRLAPILLLAAISATDFSLGANHSVVSLLVIVPLLAANFSDWRTTAIYGLLTLIAFVLLSERHHQFVVGTTRTAAEIRGGGIVFGCLIAIAVAITRQRRERRFRAVQDVAEVAQRAILEPMPTRLRGLEIAAHYESSAQEATVGGDFYHAVVTKFGVRVLVGDVRGKGLDAVRLASAVLGSFRERAEEVDDVAELVEYLHRAVARRAELGEFVTAVVAQVDNTGRLALANAGHPSPLLRRGSHVVPLNPPVPRPPLGFDAETPVLHHSLAPGDMLLLFTDGATEARHRDDGEFRDEPGLVQDMLDARRPQDLVRKVFDGLLKWTGGNLVDDVAVVALQVQKR
jgi:serine phosphatase RsbU (regulator of sigma subunit)